MTTPGFQSPPIVARSARNPILHTARWPYPANAVFNAGATLLDDGSTLLLCRVEDRRGFSHLTAARSRDGESDWRIDPEPTLSGDSTPAECWGIEDPRVTRLEDEGRFAVCFTSYGEFGPCVSLATTRDFRSFERLGVALPPNNKDAAVFPGRIDGRYAMLHRPTCPVAGAGVWICDSKDLIHWGDHRPVMAARAGGWWDSAKIGLASPPIRTDAGWLMLYHGVRQTAAGAIYRVGASLLDLRRPDRVIARGDEWLLSPETDDERVGDVGNVVFPCGATVLGSSLRIYYGMADTSIGLATVNLPGLLDWLATARHRGNNSPVESTPGSPKN